MEKKLYDKTFGGYYIMSVLLGLLLAFTLVAMLDVAAIDGVRLMPDGQADALDVLDMAWTLLPLRIFGDLSRMTAPLSISMVCTAILAVGIFVRMSGTTGSRTKISQAMATTFFLLMLMLAFAWVLHPWGRNRALALVPVVLMMIPLMVLKRTQQKHTDTAEIVGNVKEWIDRNPGSVIVGLDCLIIVAFLILASFLAKGRLG